MARKLDRNKFMTEEELRRLLLAARTRVRTSDGGRSFLQDGSRRGSGDPHPNMARDYALLVTAALTGVREVELVSFRVADLRGVLGDTRDERPGRVKIRRAKRTDRETGLPGVDEWVVLPETARRAVLDYLESLPEERKRPLERVFRLSPRQAQRTFRLYARRAGLNPAYSMHSLRHTRGTILYRKHRDLKLVQDALGHANIETSFVYMHTVDMDERLAATDMTEGGDDGKDGRGLEGLRAD